jgi:hypothetical protein
MIAALVPPKNPSGFESPLNYIGQASALAKSVDLDRVCHNARIWRNSVASSAVGERSFLGEERGRQNF